MPVAPRLPAIEGKGAEAMPAMRQFAALAMSRLRYRFNCGEFARFKPLEFETFRKQAGLNSFSVTARK